MLAKPIVQELTLAASSAELAMDRYILKDAWKCPTSYKFGTIRICPPLKVAKRFRAFVTWVPTTKTVTG